MTLFSRIYAHANVRENKVLANKTVLQYNMKRDFYLDVLYMEVVDDERMNSIYTLVKDFVSDIF